MNEERIIRTLETLQLIKIFSDASSNTHFFEGSSTIISATLVSPKTWSFPIVARQLIVLFKSGHAYTYLAEEDENILEEMVAAESPGKFVYARLKSLQSRKLDDVETRGLIHALIQHRILSYYDDALARAFILSNHPLLELYNSKYFKPSL